MLLIHGYLPIIAANSTTLCLASMPIAVYEQRQQRVLQERVLQFKVYDTIPRGPTIYLPRFLHQTSTLVHTLTPHHQRGTPQVVPTGMHCPMAEEWVQSAKSPGAICSTNAH